MNLNLMDKFLEKLKSISRITMEPSRKEFLRGRLVQFMDARALVAEPVSVPFGSIFARRLLVPAGAFALLILVGGGSTLAAESALPGDPLYIVKLKVNEPLIGALKVSDMAKTEWHTEVAVRRLEEADKLAISNKLNDGAKDQIEGNFKRSSAVATERIAALSEKGDTVAASNINTKFESSLKAHSEILAKLGERQGNDSASLKTAVSEALGTVAAASGKQDMKATSKPGLKIAASTKASLASKAIAEIKEYVAKNGVALGSEATLAAEVRIEKANALLSLAEEQLKVEDWSDAFQSANRALRAAQETKVLAHAQLIDSHSVAVAETAPTVDSGARTMSVTAKIDNGLNLLEDSSGSAAAIMAAPVSTSTEPKSSVSSEPADASNTLNVDGELRSDP
jgi:hypothetical protein